MIRFSCARCGRSYSADEAHVGKQLRCTGCGDIVTIAPRAGHCANAESTLLHRKEPIEVVVPLKRKALWSRDRRVKVAAVLILVLSLCSISYIVGRGNSVPGNRSGSAIEHAGQTVATKTMTAGPSISANEPWAAIRANPESASSPIPAKSVDRANDSSVDLLAGLVPAPETLGVSTGEKTRIRKRRSAPIELDPSEVEFAPAPKHLAVSLPTGTRLMEGGATGGRGELEALNGTVEDAYLVVVKANTRERVRQIYIKKADKWTLDRLTSGDYQVLFATGMDWDATRERFRQHGSYFSFGKTLSFEETAESYSHQTITLYSVPHGNVHPVTISEAQFHASSGTSLRSERK